MALPQSLVAHQALSRRTGLPRVLLAAALCTFLVVLACGFLSHSPVSAPTSLFLRDGVPNDREIEFESTVGWHFHFEVLITVLTWKRRLPSIKVPKQV
jgi:hypothetical protein